MNIDKAIRIRCGGEIHIGLNELNFFQKKLKSITETDFKKLKDSLVKDGLPIAFHVWWNPKKKQWDIMDGHHRYLALKALETEGYFIPPIPCNKVLAENRKEAAKIVLISNSRYARMSQESLSDFMIDFELKLDDIELLDFADINYDHINAEEVELPYLDDSDKSDFEQITFTVHRDQAKVIKAGIKVAIQNNGNNEDASTNTNKNGNALTLICEEYLNGQG